MLGLNKVAKAIFGSSNDRYVKSLQPLVRKINDLEPRYEAMTDAELQDQTRIFRERLAAGEKLDSLIPDAFATVILELEDSDEPVWAGCWDGERWCDTFGDPLKDRVSAWAHMPAGQKGGAQ